MKKELQMQARSLRLKGYSIKELHQMLGVSKSSISEWVRDVKLSKKAQARLIQNYTKGQIASQKSIQEKTKQKNLEANRFAFSIVEQVDPSCEMALLLCALIYQCEGSKNIRDSITFTNSDPYMIKTFLFLFRQGFVVDEKKFRVLMHLHRYHNEKTQKKFWSKIASIPIEQFNKTYLKPNNEKYKKEGYQGCIQIRYNDVVIGRKLQAIAKMFMERYK